MSFVVIYMPVERHRSAANSPAHDSKFSPDQIRLRVLNKHRRSFPRIPLRQHPRYRRRSIRSRRIHLQRHRRRHDRRDNSKLLLIGNPHGYAGTFYDAFHKNRNPIPHRSHLSVRPARVQSSSRSPRNNIQDVEYPDPIDRRHQTSFPRRREPRET